MAMDLLGPTVISEPGGVTFLSGGNVALAPQGVSAAVERLAGGVANRPGKLPFLAFSRGRRGIVGCTGRVEVVEGVTVLSSLETFGARSAIREFGMDLAAFLAKPGRFERPPGVALAGHAGTGTGWDLLVGGILEGGLSPAGAAGRIDGTPADRSAPTDEAPLGLR